ncbi:MAG: Transcriptional regulator, TrmB [Candidatus Magasanikbacteria bacterium GW2011_GWA2_56_11]|uniref:Transcriptional regulator, TrmB n=1 Tax=Candidatus Magasanikbacteria bacterium GW2011_GWA2_56_11 TaxID=1619044 RepID=A0A0G2ALF5_9BACT|nr:MAG: Transcriptional regulator, TrmB [Candidatus Magasanikbacteria bacterium GW2011_GWA2_56_11]
MDLHQNLAKIGLTDKQSAVYLASLQLGVAPVSEIARYAGLKRPTVYLLLDDLEKIGLVSKTKKERRTLFKAEEPKRLLTDLAMKRELVEGMLPSLEAIYNVNPEKPAIKIGEGVASVKNAYINIFTYLATHPQEELLIFGSLKDAAEHFEAQVLDFFYRSMAKSRNPVREIGNDDHETRKYYRASARLNPRHDIRLIRNEGRFFQTDNMLYGNTLVIFSVKEQIFCITIESPNIAETYRTLFNLAWKSGKSI